MADRISLTGVPDTDRLILLQVPPESLKSVCVVDKQINALCDNEFWRKRFTQDFVDLKTVPSDFDYRKAYWRVYRSAHNLQLDDEGSLLDYAIQTDLLELFKWWVSSDSGLRTISAEIHFMWAVAGGALSIVRYLVEEKGVTPFVGDVGSSHNSAVVDYLLSKGVDVLKESQRILTNAIEVDDLTMFSHMRALVEKSGKPFPFLSGYAKIAADNGAPQILAYLLPQIKLSPGLLDDLFFRATVRALGSQVGDLYKIRNINALQVLLDASAPIDGINGDGKPLIDGSSLTDSRAIDVVRFFVEHGAKIESYGHSVLIQAAKSANHEVVDYLIQQGVTISEKERQTTEDYLRAFGPPFNRYSSDLEKTKSLLKIAVKTVSPKLSPRRSMTQDTNKASEIIATARPRSPRQETKKSSEIIATAKPRSPRKETTAGPGKETNKVQCKAITKAGSQCRKWAVHGTDYCSIH